jgi:hypothetical protein
MTFQRRFEPDPEALDRVVEILYRLLVESPNAALHVGESRVSPAQEPPCVVSKQE